MYLTFKMSKSKIHIYWFAPYNLTCPSTRYRGKYPLEYLKENSGIEYDFVIPDSSTKGIFHFIKVYFSILLFRKKNSLIVIQKICSNRIYANALKILIRISKKNTIYDLDDAEYYRQPVNTLHYFLRNCQYVQTGSSALLKYCLQFIFILEYK